MEPNSEFDVIHHHLRRALDRLIQPSDDDESVRELYDAFERLEARIERLEHRMDATFRGVGP